MTKMPRQMTNSQRVTTRLPAAKEICRTEQCKGYLPYSLPSTLQKGHEYTLPTILRDRQQPCLPVCKAPTKTHRSSLSDMQIVRTPSPNLAHLVSKTNYLGTHLQILLKMRLARSTLPPALVTLQHTCETKRQSSRIVMPYSVPCRRTRTSLRYSVG